MIFLNYPTLNSLGRTQEYIQEFKGYNHSLRIGSSEFFDMENLSCDDYPVISTRKRRYEVAQTSSCRGMVSKGFEHPMWLDTDPSDTRTSPPLWIYDNGRKQQQASTSGGLFIQNAGTKDRQMIKLGSKVCIFPDKIWFETEWDDGEEVNIIKTWNLMEIFRGELPTGNVSTSGSYRYTNVNFVPCDGEGNIYELSWKQHDEPTKKPSSTTENIDSDDNGKYWLYVPDKTNSDNNKKYGESAVLFRLSYRNEKASWNQVYDWKTAVKDDFGSYLFTGLKTGDVVDFYFTDDTTSNDTPLERSDNGDYTSDIKVNQETYLTEITKKSFYKYVSRGYKIIGELNGMGGIVLDIQLEPFTFKVTGPETVSLEYSSNFLSFAICRSVPDLAYVTEYNNRLWGCSEDGHEIYCTKLGDPDNWYAYEGISTDAEAITVGTDGVFTGCVAWNGQILFFKEECIHKVYGDYTPYTSVTLDVKGVQKGSYKGIAIIDGVLYYKASDGIYSYTGSIPQKISSPLGHEIYYEAVFGTCGKKLYCSMKDGLGVHKLFVYDTQTGIWTKEQDTYMRFCCECDGDMFFLDGDDGKIKTVNGTKGKLNLSSESIYGNVGMNPFVPKEESPFGWFFETGELGLESPDKKSLSRFMMRLKLEKGASLTVSLMYDSSGTWQEYRTVNPTVRMATVNIPIVPRRCDHVRIKVSGKGAFSLFGISKMYKYGSRR